MESKTTVKYHLTPVRMAIIHKIMLIKTINEAEQNRKREEWKIWLKTQHSKNEDHGIWSHHFMANRWGNNENGDKLYFLGGLQNQCRW